MWTGELLPSRVLTRIHGLQSDPQSRFRSAWLRDHPPKVSDGAPPWQGWSVEAGLLAQILNQQIAQGRGKKLRASDLVKTPADQKPLTQKFSSIREFASTFTRR